jgi:hypothetical protein
MFNDEQLAYAKTRAGGVAVSDHDCVRCPQCDSCPACAADALDHEVVVREELFAAWEAHKKAYEIVRAEMDDVQRTLTHCGVPEQIPPFKAALAPAKARVLYLSARCNQLFDEAADTQERLDQFEAYDITVKSALEDRDRADRYEAALRPFAAVGERFVGNPLAKADGMWLWKSQSNVRDEPGITISDVLRARAALAGGGAAEREKEGANG